MSNHKGSIDFIMIDESRNNILELGGADFDDQSRLAEQWQLIQSYSEHTMFVADLKDEHGSIIDDKNVTSEDIVQRLGSPIDLIIAKARNRSNRHLQ